MATSAELTVIVCTLGEAAVAETVESITSSARVAARPIEIVVVWQGLSTPPSLGDGVRMLDVFPVGLAYARNRGLDAAATPLVAFVDDDELVDPGWAGGVFEGFSGDATAVFGPVEPLDDRGLPYCSYVGGEPRVFRGRRVRPWVVGTGGNMAFRREELLAAGGFDPRFGIGAPARSAEDSDIVLRLLRAGRSIAWSPEMVVYHPTKNESEHLASRYPYGFGMGSVLRRHRAVGHGLRYLVAIGQSFSAGLRTRSARRRREARATLRSFLEGTVSGIRPLAPLGPLARLPDEVRAKLDGVEPVPLPSGFDGVPHFRYAVGADLLLNLYVSEPDTFDSAGEVVARANGRGAHWVLERVR
jgi:hypothetical protein